MIISVTGHRPDKLGGFQEATFLTLVGVAKEAIPMMEADMVITGMALGWDQAIAQACIELGVPFIAAIPFKTQPCKWQRAHVDRWNNLCRQARDVVVVCEGEYEPWKMHKRNEWMVDNASSVLSLWDPSELRGGTFGCVKYAVGEKKQVMNAWDIFQHFINPDVEGIIRCPDLKEVYASDLERQLWVTEKLLKQ